MDDFDFKIIDKFLGYNSTSDKTTLPGGYLIRGSKNVVKTIRGTIASRCGLLRRGEADSTDAGVKASYEWSTSVGTIRNLRICNGKFEVESNILDSDTYLWYEIFGSGAPTTSLAATLTRWIFDAWWDDDEKTDRLLAVRGDGNIIHWSGGMALAASGTINTITIGGVIAPEELGFATQVAAEKKLMIDGTEYTYTGISGQDFTGVSPSAAALTANAVIIQSAIVDEPDDITGATFDFVKVIQNQAWYGAYSSRVIYISADANAGGVPGFLNLVNANDLIPGDPDKIVMDNPGRGIGITPDGKVALFAGDSDMVIVTPNVNVSFAFSYDGSNDRFVFQKIEKKKLPGLNAALGQEFIANAPGGELVWIDQKHQLRALTAVTGADQIKPVHLSLPVQTELAEDDFTGGHLRVIEDTFHLTSPNNGRDWMYQIRQVLDENGATKEERVWQPPQIRGLARIALIEGVKYGHSNVNPQLYQLDETAQWYDDNPAGEMIPYTCVMRLPYLSHERRQGRITFDKTYFEGYSYQGVDLRYNLYCDYKGFDENNLSEMLPYVINSEDDPAKFFGGTVDVSIGRSAFGDNPLGDGILEEGSDQELVPKFRAIVQNHIRSFFEYSIEIYSEEEDSRWEILAVGPNVRIAEDEANFLTK
jgi:hypothetical protein